MQHQLQHSARHKYQVCEVEAELEKRPTNAIYHQAILPFVIPNCAVSALPQLETFHCKSHGSAQDPFVEKIKTKGYRW